MRSEQKSEFDYVKVGIIFNLREVICEYLDDRQ